MLSGTAIRPRAQQHRAAPGVCRLNHPANFGRHTQPKHKPKPDPRSPIPPHPLQSVHTPPPSRTPVLGGSSVNMWRRERVVRIRAPDQTTLVGVRELTRRKKLTGAVLTARLPSPPMRHTAWPRWRPPAWPWRATCWSPPTSRRLRKRAASPRCSGSTCPRTTCQGARAGVRPRRCARRLVLVSLLSLSAFR